MRKVDLASTDVSDTELTDAARKGDVTAFHQLYLRHTPVARRVAARVTSPSSVDDVVAESFTATFAALRNGLGPRDGFRSYLLATVRRTAQRWNSDQQKTTPVEDLGTLPHLPTADPADVDLSAAEDRRLVRTAYQSLTERTRHVLWLVDVEELSYADCADTLQTTPHAVRSLLKRGRRELADAYLAAQISTRTTGEGHPSATELARFVRNRLTQTQHHTVEAHLAQCPACLLRQQEAIEAGSTLRAGLAPAAIAGLVLGYRVPLDRVAGAAAGTAAATTAGSALGPGTLLAFGAAVVAVAATVALLLWPDGGGPPDATIAPPSTNSTETSSDEPLESDTPTETDPTTTDPTQTDATDAVPTGQATVTWGMLPDLTTAQVEDRVSLPFRLSTGDSARTALSLVITLPTGLDLAPGYPTCTADGRTVTCAGIGPLPAGRTVDGAVGVVVSTVPVTSTPLISVTTD